MAPKKPTSEKQKAANRRNARKSSGPRTAAGKAKSRWNALKHGILVRALIPPGLEAFESPQALHEMLDGLFRDLQPVGTTEEILVERIACDYWRLARLFRAEAGAIARRRLSPLGEADVLHILSALVPGPAPSPFAPVTPESLMRQYGELRIAIGYEEKLREVLSREDEKWRVAPMAEMTAFAQARMDSLLERLDQQQAGLNAAEEDSRSIPAVDVVMGMARYESMLSRDIHRCLSDLERLQRRRAGEYVPPPIDLAVTGVEPADP